MFSSSTWDGTMLEVSTPSSASSGIQLIQRLARSGRPNGTRHSCVLLGRDLVVSPGMGASQLSPTESEDRRHQRPGVMMAHRPYGSTGHTARLGRAKKLVNAGLEPDIISHRRNPREPTPNSWDRTPMEERQDHGYLTRPPATYSSDFEKNLPNAAYRRTDGEPGLESA
ncbi:hypothetical protein PGTUg99_016407 [Puccinia graminis f. sp. tritici]|uniref:Uncharacterized protein n=1 Tax=Puccinia graminis f. sp. tritici TaxID=56615 RepID=A0A5B0QSF8_PUCGR|nr:hypothetical protein PGTUg99_016407 [Puccinia graminis f. sp. tritici]